MDSIWQAISGSKYLRDKGCTISAESSEKMIALRGLGSVPDGVSLTVNRSLYDQGLSDMEGRLYFASYGDPVFEDVLNEIASYDFLPECIFRLTVKVPDLNAEVVAYAAACVNDSGLPQVRLITSWDDLKGLQLAKTTTLSESDLAGLKKRLHDMVRQEFDPIRAVERLEKNNLRTARAQIIMDLLAIRSLLSPVGSIENDNFWTIVKDHLYVLISERNQLIIQQLPVDPLKKIGKELFFDLQLPKVGQTTSMTAPILLVCAAVDAGCRLAEGMKVKKSTLTVDMVQSRIENEIKRQLKEFKSI